MKVAIVGCGKLGSAIAKMLIGKYEVLAIRRNLSKIELECEKSSRIEDAKDCDIVIITLKPESFRSLDLDLDFGDKIVVSFMAGVGLKELKKVGKKVVKAMTSISAEFGLGFVTYCCDLSEEEEKVVFELLENLGSPLKVEEGIVDASIAFACSLAYISKLLIAACYAGIRLGIDADTSMFLAISAFEGCIRAVKEEGVEEVVRDVATPTGATVEGLAKLMECRAEWCLQEAIFKAGKKFNP